MNFTNTDSVEKKLDDAEYDQWCLPVLWDEGLEAAPVFFQVCPVTGQIKTKIKQELNK